MGGGGHTDKKRTHIGTPARGDITSMQASTHEGDAEAGYDSATVPSVSWKRATEQRRGGRVADTYDTGALGKQARHSHHSSKAPTTNARRPDGTRMAVNTMRLSNPSLEATKSPVAYTARWLVVAVQDTTAELFTARHVSACTVVTS
jgi:hypothetical protein